MKPQTLLALLLLASLSAGGCKAQKAQPPSATPGQQATAPEQSADPSIQAVIDVHCRMIAELRKVDFEGGDHLTGGLPPGKGAAIVEKYGKPTGRPVLHGLFVQYINACANINEAIFRARKTLPELQQEAYIGISQRVEGDPPSLTNPKPRMHFWISRKAPTGAVFLSETMWRTECRYELVNGKWLLDLDDFRDQPALNQPSNIGMTQWMQVNKRTQNALRGIDEGKFQNLKSLVLYLVN